MANLKIITDPFTKEQFARDLNDPKSIYQSYTAPLSPPTTDTPAAPSGQPPTPSTLTTPASPPSGVQAPTLPTPTAPAVHQDYMLSATEQAAQTRSTLDSTLQKNLDSVTAQKKQAQDNIDSITNKQDQILQDQVQPLTQPFRQQLETSERDRLKVEENYFANQKLTDELDGLLTQGNALIERTKAQPVAQQVLDKRVAKTMSDVAARAGVIQAVMAARNNQISVAENMIDRSVAAVNADRQDQLSYYSTLLDFYDKQKDEEGNKVADLTTDQRTFLNAQIDQLKSDANSAQDNADYIKKAMLDPDTAQAYGSAGVTLNDSPEQIAQKLAQYGYQKELADTSNKMATSGYTYVLPGQSAPAGSQVVTVTDSKGNQKQYYKAGSAGAGGAAGYNGEFAATIDLASNANKSAPNVTKQAIKNQLQSYVAAGDYPSAYQGIVQQTRAGLDSTNATRFDNAFNLNSTLDDLKSSLQAYSDAGGNTNILTGTEDQIQTKLGVLVTDPKYASLAVQLDTAYQNYRLMLTGANFSSAEASAYASVLPQKGNTLALNLAKIQGAQAAANSTIEGSIKSVVGQGGISIKQYAEGAAPPAQASADVTALATQNGISSDELQQAISQYGEDAVRQFLNQ